MGWDRRSFSLRFLRSMASSPSTVVASRTKNWEPRLSGTHQEHQDSPSFALELLYYLMEYRCLCHVEDVSLKVKYACQNVTICWKVSKVLRLAKVICNGWDVNKFRLIMKEKLQTKISWLSFEMWWSTANIHQPSMLTDVYCEASEVTWSDPYGMKSCDTVSGWACQRSNAGWVLKNWASLNIPLISCEIFGWTVHNLMLFSCSCFHWTEMTGLQWFVAVLRVPSLNTHTLFHVSFCLSLVCIFVSLLFSYLT